RDRERGVAVEVLLHERERESHARRHPSGGPDVAVAQEDRLGVYLDARVAAGELGGREPVRGRTASLEQARAREQERARAHGGGAPGSARVAREPLDQHGIGGGLLATGAARDDQRV